MTFSDYRAHTNLLFSKLKILKFFDRIFFRNALFMHDFCSNKLPQSFNTYFVEVSKTHKYHTRLASKSSFSLPKVRTNFEKFNIRYTGAQVWNLVDESIKKLSKNKFKIKLKMDLLNNYFL
jgi:hypothetical protein